MGASGWLYYTPFVNNIEESLQALRQQIFQSGDFHSDVRDTRDQLVELSPEEAEAYFAETQANRQGYRLPMLPVKSASEWIDLLKKNRFMSMKMSSIHSTPGG